MNILNKALLGGSVVDAGSKVSTSLKTSENPYDKILGNGVVKTTTKNGEMNAINSNNPMYRDASELLDVMYNLEKIAGVKDKIVVGAKKIMGTLEKADKAMAGHLSEAKVQRTAYNATKDPARMKAYRKEMIAASKVIVPAGAVGIAGTVGTVHGIKALEKKFNKNQRPGSNPIQEAGDSAYPYAAGAGLLGAGVFDAVSNKSVLAPVKHMGKGLKNGLYKYPKKVGGKAGKTGKMLFEVLKAATRNASEEIDTLFEKEASAEEVIKGKELLKKLVVKDFFQEGVKSIPYSVAPAVASYAVGRDLRHGGGTIKDNYNDDQIVIDVPLKDVPKNRQKLASIDIPSIEKMLKNDFPEKAVQGLSRAVFPTAVIALTGKNITNAMEDVRGRRQDRMPELEEGKARVTIQLSPKKASEDIDDLFFEKKAEDNSFFALGNTLDSIKKKLIYGERKI